MVILKTKTGMIPANETEVLFTDVDIEDESIIEVYYDSNDVYTVETSQTENNVLIVVSEHSNPVGVKLLINNVTSFSPYDDSSIVQHLGLVDQTLSTINTELNELNERVPQDALIGGVLYHSNTGNMWKKLDATNLNYDDDSTLYSAMGDIDSLETTSKNLVGAINEVKESGGGATLEDISRYFTVGSEFNMNSLNAYKYGNIVILNGRVDNNVAINKNISHVLLTCSNPDLYPSTTQRGMVAITGTRDGVGMNNYVEQLGVSTGGNLYSYLNYRYLVNAQFFFMMVYVV